MRGTAVILLWGLFTCCQSSTRNLSPAAGGRASVISPDAPAWAKAGDRRSGDGAYFVCEGMGANEDEAMSTAKGVCSAKICELCGVEVKATVETTETLDGVSMQRKVMETCRRVRRKDDTMRYKQSSCGPEGCFAWIEIFYSKEDEARECRAYADDNFADPEACEGFVEEFRRTPGLSAASFDTRKTLLEQAIVACADIDVRPTPRLQALDEVLWQGVLAPRLLPWEKRRDDVTQPMPERTRIYLEDQAERDRRQLAQSAYKPLGRQGLIETKIFVERLATVRDFMHAYSTVMRVFEESVQVRYLPHQTVTKLLQSMEQVQAVHNLQPRRMHFIVAEVLTGSSKDRPKVTQWLLARYENEDLSYQEASTLVALFTLDHELDDAEWQRVLKLCVGCASKALSRDATRKNLVQRLNEAAARLQASAHADRLAKDLVAVMQNDELLRQEAKLSPLLAKQVTWDRLKSRAAKLAPPGENQAHDGIRAGLALRLEKQLEEDVATDTKYCSKLGGRLDTLDGLQRPTRRFLAAACSCLENAGNRRVGTYDDLYLRLLRWQASCVAPRGDRS